MGGSVETVRYPSARSLLSFFARMSSVGEPAVSVVVFTGKTLNNAGPWPASLATPAHPGTISPQVTSVKVTLFSVVGTENTIITERFIIYFLHSQFYINNFSFFQVLFNSVASASFYGLCIMSCISSPFLMSVQRNRNTAGEFSFMLLQDL